MTVPDPPIIEDSAPEPPERCPECYGLLTYADQVNGTHAGCLWREEDESD